MHQAREGADLTSVEKHYCQDKKDNSYSSAAIWISALVLLCPDIYGVKDVLDH